MLELIALIGAAILIVWMPIETRKVAGGWVRPKHKGTPEEFRRQYRRQLTMFFWIGLVLGLGNFGLAALPDQDDARRIVRAVVGALWLGVAISGALSRRRLDAAPA
ncbi:hypothetical protein GXW74_18425 [Roseomonas eburnea]|uniref:Uncharacterized protein n=1 Tax=Neoroseomonas eburnea TaxID=1346889 RepID=A0A9X9XFI8_9PROT|nr:hypothetical protein [Neoroseomonas eburnea]MBR0682474.1 hypothetical protein [Neoroseomonas eburnea]